MSCSCLCQHVEQRGIVGEGSNIKGNQTLVAHPVDPSLPLLHPILLFPIPSLPQASPSPHATADVVSGQQALDSQGVLILHCLPQALVLQGSKTENLMSWKRKHIKKIEWLSVEGFFHEGTEGVDAQRTRFNVTRHINQIMNQSLIHENEVILAKSACHV